MYELMHHGAPVMNS